MFKYRHQFYVFVFAYPSACCAGFYYHQSNLWLMCQNMCSHYVIIMYLVKSSALILEAIIICLFALNNISTRLLIHILLILVSLPLNISLLSTFLSLCFFFMRFFSLLILFVYLFPLFPPSLSPFMTWKYKFNTKYLHFSSQRSFQ